MGKKIEVSEKDILKIKDMYEIKGLSPKKIHLQLSIPLGTLHRVIIENKMIKAIIPKYTNITKENLYNLYVNKKYTLEKAAKFFKVSKKVISDKCKEYDIKVRYRGGCAPKGIKEKDLLQMYINQKFSMLKIAKSYGCAVSTIQSYFKKYKIKARDRSIIILKKDLEDLYVNQKLSISKISEKLGYCKEIIKRHLELYGYKTPKKTESISHEDLKELCDKGFSVKEMSSKYHCSTETIRRILRIYKLKTQKSALQNVPCQKLYYLLVTQKKEIKEVASLYNVSESSIKLKLREYGINLVTERTKNITEETLKRMYYEKGMSQREIANYFKIGRSFLSKKFKEYGITKKNKSDCLTKDVLRDLYVKQNIPQCDIAKKFGLNAHQVLYKIKIYHLENEKTEEQRAECRARAYERALGNSRSKAELEIQKLFPTPFTNVHSIINLELDLWYPEKRIAIEYNGDYWHSIKFPRNSGLHLAKLSMCENRGVHLINIFERDWNNKKLKGKIVTFLSRLLNPEKFKNLEGDITNSYNFNRKKFEDTYNLLNESNAEFTVGLINSKKEFIASLSYNIKNSKCYIERFTTHKDYIEDYTSLILYLKDKYNLPIIIKCDKRYYNSFPSLVKPITSREIAPELFLVVGNKAKRENEASEEYKNHLKCFKVYDCGFIEYTL